MNNISNSGNDAEVVATLYQLQILDTAREEEFDNIAILAAQICETDSAVIGFTDSKRFWFKARVGLRETFTEIPGGLAFCRNAVEETGIAIVEDTLENEILCDNPHILREGIRFIASVPLIDNQKLTIGYLCVFAPTPRKLSEQQANGLKMLAMQVTSLLMLRIELLKNSVDNYKEVEAQMKTIFLNSIDAVVVTDKEGLVLQWNPKAEEMFGWEEKEIAGKYFHKTCIPERYSDSYLKALKKSNNNNIGDANKSVEIKAVDRQTNEFDVAIGISPAIIRSRTYYICFISDITDRKRATEELDKQKEFYENILNNIPTDIAVFDSNHKYLFVNPSAIRNVELRKYIIGKDDFEYAIYRNRDTAGAELRRAKFLEAKETAKEIRWEDNLKSPEGIPFTHLRRMFPVHDKNGELTMVIGYGIDITERKEMEEKQSILLKKLSIQNTQLVDFCNIVSHNLRAPMVNMLLLVDFINESNDVEEQKLLVSEIKPVLDNLNTTFSELVESIQVKEDVEAKIEQISFVDCLNRAMEGLKTEISSSGAVIEVSFDKVPAIMYPSKYLYSIFQNLISNALKYRSPDRISHIKLKTIRKNKSVILSVSDNGLGIDLTKHGESFFKIGKTFHHHPHAKGFGLFMIKTHIEALNGKIWVESAPDKGATFFIEFTNQPLCNL